MTAPLGAYRRPPRQPPARPPANHRVRLLILLTVLVLGFALIISRLADLQVLSPERYREVGTSQRTFSQKLAADRGAITDRNGVELAMSKPARSVFVDPQLIDDPVALAAVVAPVLDLRPADVEKKMRSEGRFAYLARKVPDEVADRIAALKEPGVALVEESSRYHPAGTLAGSVLGGVDVDNVGLSGMEKRYGDALAGQPGSVLFERGPGGQTIAVGDHQLVPAIKGDDLVLTLDRSIQYETERILREQVEDKKAKGGTAIVSRPDTGEILAMANVMRDPKTDEVVLSADNTAVTMAYEPGSVLKMVTVAAAMEHGVATPEKVYEVPSALRIADAEFTDSEPHGTLSWSVAEILTHSSNIGTIKIAQQLTKTRLYDALMSFGFGQRTAVAFPNEQEGYVPAPGDWWDTSIGTVPIGHGVSVTPLQMLQAYNVVANGGVYVEPRLVRGTVDADGVEHLLALGDGHRVLSEVTADKMNLMLRDVVKEGTGKLASINGYTPAGKTGTSRKAQPNGTYLDASGVMQYQSTFVGFVPAEQPALSILVMIDEPRGTDYTGGAVAAPAFAEIASFGLRHLSQPPPVTDAAADGKPVTSGSASPTSTVARSAPVVRDQDGRVLGRRAEEAPPTTLGASTSSTSSTSSTTTTTVPRPRSTR